MSTETAVVEKKVKISDLKKRGLVGAFEALEEEVEENPTEITEETASIPEELEEGAEELDEENEEVSEIAEAINEGEEDVAVLDRISDVMTDSIEAGEGLDENAAKIAEVAIESIYSRLGMSKRKVIPAMESFGNKTTRLSATRMALEELEEGKKTIGESLKGWIKEVSQRTVETIKKAYILIRSYEGLAKKYKSLAGSMEDGEVSQIKSSSVAEAFGFLGSITGDTIAKQLQEQGDKSTKLIVNLVDAYKKSNEAVGGIFNDKNPPKVEAILKVIHSAQNAAIKSVGKHEGKAVVVGPFIGGKQLVIDLAGEGEEAKYDSSWVDVEGKKESPEEFAALSKADIIKVCDAVLGIFAKSKEAEDKWNWASQDFESTDNLVYKGLQKIKDIPWYKESEGEINKASNALGCVQKQLIDATGQVFNNNSKAMQNALLLCSLSLKKAGKPAEAPSTSESTEEPAA